MNSNDNSFACISFCIVSGLLVCVDFIMTNHGGVPGPSAVIEPRDLRFHVKIVFLVTEIFVFCIQAKVTYCWHSLSSMG